MNILILNRKSLKERPLYPWFEGEDTKLYLLCDKTARDGLSDDELKQQYSGCKFIDEYSANGEVELTAEEWHRQIAFNRIASFSELDVSRAALLRERWGLQGQSRESAMAFRDKYIMKSLVASAGLAVPPMAPVENPIDIYEFSSQYGFPIVIKPRTGSGSVGTQVIRSSDALTEFFSEKDGVSNFRSFRPLMIEKFIDGALLHIDGIMKDGQARAIWASRYLAAGYETMQGNGHNAGIMLDAGSKLNESACRFIENVIEILPCPLETTSFHGEIFYQTTTQKFTLCEIASRSGGGGIVEMHEAAWGVNINRTSLRGQAGLHDAVKEWRSPSQFGFFNYAAGNGTLLDAPTDCPLIGIHDYRFTGEIGKTYAGPRNCIDNIASTLVSGECEQEIKDRMSQFQKWFSENVVWSH